MKILKHVTNDELLLRPVAGQPGSWTVEEPFEHHLHVRHMILKARVPSGFKTDLASVPRGLWSIFPPFGRYTAAAVLHDYLYRVRRVENVKLSRKECDHAFLAAMKQLKVAPWKRFCIMRAVRWFGWIPWGNAPYLEEA